MNKLKAKLKNGEGFTLVEMLIVVAIIAILIAISIPMINKALERSRHAVDQANIRDAVSLGMVEYLTNPELFKKDATNTVTSVKMAYKVDENTHKGTLVDISYDATLPTTGVKVQCRCAEGGDHSTNGLYVTISDDGDVTASWKSDPSFKNSTQDAP